MFLEMEYLNERNGLDSVYMVFIIQFDGFLPTLTGNRVSLFIWASAHSISNEMYCGAGNFVGFLYLFPSAQRYSNLGPPDIVVHELSVQ